MRSGRTRIPSRPCWRSRITSRSILSASMRLKSFGRKRLEHMTHRTMVTMRESQQIAKRALILGTIALRASLEVTDHPRAVEASQQLLRWLNQVGCDGEIDPIERGELATPLGQLSD